MANPVNKGRHGDSMLVHMNPAEVGGLAALAEMHGRRMTINPETGYPEAFSLGDILPTIVGLGASAASGGTLAPWMAGGLAGLTSYATTGSLEKGLMTGLTAGGLSAMGNNLAATGAEAATAGASAAPTTDFLANNPAYSEAMNAGRNVAQSGATNAIMAAKPPTPPQGVMGPGAGSSSGGMFDSAIQRFGDMGKGIKALNQSGGWGDFMSANKKPIMAAGAGIMGNMAYEDQLRQREEMEEQRAGRLRDKQKDYTGSVAAIRDNYADAGRDFRLGSLSASPNFNRKYYAKGGMAESDKNQIYQDIALSYLDAGREVPGSLSRYLPQNNKIAPAPRGYGSPFGGITNIWAMGQRNNQPSMPFGPNFGVMGGFNQYGPRYTGLEGLQGRNQNYKPQPFERIQDKSQGPRQMIANTDEILSGMSVPRGTPAQAPASAQPQGMVQPANQVLQQAGMNPATKKMAGGGDVDGPGDGMSDDIMTTIDGRDPAALSDGEFVIPADVVSHLGNGSSDAGAQRLYEMMARVRKARTGKEKQGKEINPRGMMPA